MEIIMLEINTAILKGVRGVDFGLHRCTERSTV
jgi:hypothetical protein